MSRPPVDETPWSQQRIANALERIADTLDDYVDYALAAAKAAQTMRTDPEGTLDALYKVIDEAIASRSLE